jgi:hypothetical protein
MASTYEAYLLSLIAPMAVPVTVIPTSTTAQGTPSVGSTETFDAVLGYYQCNLIAGRRYMAIMNGLVGNCGTAGDIYFCNIRNSGSSSNPTAASTLVAQQQWTSQSIGTASRLAIPLAGTFIAPTTGLNTFGFSSQKNSGTGSFTPECPAQTGVGVGSRELFVMYLGIV